MIISLINKIAEKHSKFLVYILSALLSFAVFYTAWVVEDAFITFRTVDNFWNGYGLRWNIDERVMTYTHPLWMLLLLVVRGISDNLFIGSLILCFSFTFLTIRYLVVYSKSCLLLAIGLLGLLSSRAFIDYSTSGLENPLAHFLMLTLLVQFLVKDNKNIAIYSFIVGLILLTRLDLIFFVLPICLYIFYKSIKDFRVMQTIGRILLGAIPFFIWLIFSTYYYGSFIPNTAWAKLNHGISKEIIWYQGYLYFESILKYDVSTFYIIFFLPILYLLKVRDVKIKIVALGSIFGLFYIFNVGADYMLGRFVSVYVVTNVFVFVFAYNQNLLLNERLEKVLVIVFLDLVISIIINAFTELYINLYTLFLLIFLTIILVFYNNLSKYILRYLICFSLLVIFLLNLFNQLGRYTNSGFNSNGILDERYMYWYNSNTLFKTSSNKKKNHEFFNNGLMIKKYYKNKYYILPYIGMSAYSAGEKYYFIDPLALSDAYLAQYPIAHYPWRIGHFPRYIKHDYLKSVINNENVMVNEYDRKVLDDIWLLTKAPLDDPYRIGAIVRLHTGKIKKNAQKGYDQTLNTQKFYKHKVWGNWNSKDISLKDIIKEHRFL